MDHMASTFTVPELRSPPLRASKHCPAVGLTRNIPSALGARTARFKESLLLLQHRFDPEKQDQWIYCSTKSGWGPTG